MMGYCPTCGHEVTESQKFCSNCSTRLRGAGAPRETPPADLSTSVPRRPAGGWALEDEGSENDDLDDFFSSYRRKGPGAAAPTSAASDADGLDTPFPTRRSRRRFDPDLSYDGTPLPAAPRPATPAHASSGADGDERDTGYPPAPASGPESVPTSNDADERRSGPVPVQDRESEPVAAAPASDARVPSWFEELDRDASQPVADAPAAPNPFARAAESGTWGDFSAAAGSRPEAERDVEPVGQPEAPTDGQPEASRAGANRGFDDVLMGSREPGTETTDRPIVSRDFERTGIVHVPRLDDGSTPPPPPAPDGQQRPAEPVVAPMPVEPTWGASGDAPSPFQQPTTPNTDRDERLEPAARDAAPDAGEDPRNVFADWFGSDAVDDVDELREEPASPAPHVDPAVERQRPWYEQGLDGTELDGVAPRDPSDSKPAAASAAGAAGVAGAVAAGHRAPSARASAPTYQAPAGPGTPLSGAGQHAASGAPVDARGAGRGPSGSRGPGAGGPGGRGPGGMGGGLRGLFDGLDNTGRRRLWTIAIALAGSILLVLSAVIIGNVIGARDGQDVAATSDAATDPAAPGETAAPETPAGPPPAVANPNFEAYAFENASGNLRCIITPEIGVACQHSQPAFAIPDEACTSTDAAGLVVGLDSNGHTFPCLEDDIPRGQETPEYDTPFVVGEFVCSISDDTGVTCFNDAGDIFTFDYLKLSFAGRASESPQPTSTIPAVAE